MKTQIFYESDVGSDLLNGKRITILGYGAQGRAHALNLRDSGCDVVIGQRAGGPGWENAQLDNFRPITISESVLSADIICLMLPDELQGEIFQAEVLPRAKSKAILLTCHGFSFHYGLIPRHSNYRRLLVAPKGQGHMVRGEYLQGGGVPCLLAVDEGEEAEVLPVGLGYARAIGGTKAGVIKTTISAETETDLFGEQVVLCGGLTELIQAGFETLVESGYQPELAYFECLHELKIIVDLLHKGGISAMREEISTTAEYGDLTRGPRIIDSHVREKMREILREIQSGEFAKEFLLSTRSESADLNRLKKRTAQSLIENVGNKLRGMMPWLKRTNQDNR